jgi:hypothetical protein
MLLFSWTNFLTIFSSRAGEQGAAADQLSPLVLQTFFKNRRHFKIYRMLVILCLLVLLARFHKYIPATSQLSQYLAELTR